jgi:hypothetical protein
LVLVVAAFVTIAAFDGENRTAAAAAAGGFVAEEVEDCNPTSLRGVSSVKEALEDEDDDDDKVETENRDEEEKVAEREGGGPKAATW